MDTERGVVHISIGYPREIAEAIRRLAQEHDRSINGEVARAVREYLTCHQQQRQREGEQRP